MRSICRSTSPIPGRPAGASASPIPIRTRSAEATEFNFDYPNVGAANFEPNAGDQEHRLVANWIIDLPWDFRFSGLLNYSSGVPLFVDRCDPGVPAGPDPARPLPRDRRHAAGRSAAAEDVRAVQRHRAHSCRPRCSTSPTRTISGVRDDFFGPRRHRRLPQPEQPVAGRRAASSSAQRSASEPGKGPAPAGPVRLTK